MRGTTARRTIERIARGVMAMGLLVGVTLVAADRARQIAANQVVTRSFSGHQIRTG